MPATILVLEDFQYISSALLFLTEARRFRVHEAARVERALALARQENPDVILLDLQLARGEADRFLRMLREDPLVSQIPVIAVAYLDTDGFETQKKALAFQDWLRKPFLPAELLDRVRPWVPESKGDTTQRMPIREISGPAPGG